MPAPQARGSAAAAGSLPARWSAAGSVATSCCPIMLAGRLRSASARRASQRRARCACPPAGPQLRPRARSSDGESGRVEVQAAQQLRVGRHDDGRRRHQHGGRGRGQHDTGKGQHPGGEAGPRPGCTPSPRSGSATSCGSWRGTARRATAPRGVVARQHHPRGLDGHVGARADRHADIARCVWAWCTSSSLVSGVAS